MLKTSVSRCWTSLISQVLVLYTCDVRSRRQQLDTCLANILVVYVVVYSMPDGTTEGEEMDCTEGYNPPRFLGSQAWGSVKLKSRQHSACACSSSM